MSTNRCKWKMEDFWISSASPMKKRPPRYPTYNTYYAQNPYRSRVEGIAFLQKECLSSSGSFFSSKSSKVLFML